MQGDGNRSFRVQYYGIKTYITIGIITIETVKKYKLLGVILTDDLKWKDHVAYIYEKACKRLSLCVYYVKPVLKQTRC
jgi:hypothetical protein